MVDPVSPQREQLAKIAGSDNRLLLGLERLFQVAGQVTPDQVAKNTTDIEANTDAIAANVFDIAENLNAILDNAAAIDGNTAGIAANTANISTNTADIAANTALINGIAGTQAVSTADSPFSPTGSGTLLCDATAGPIVISLDPTVTSSIINVKKIDAGANAVTLTPTSGVVDGSATAPITTQFAAITVVSNGTDWFIL